MRILVTGPRGFVGARIMAALPATPSPSLRAMSDDDLRRLVDRAEPDVIIHTAAISDIGACDRDPEASYRANVEIPVVLARTLLANALLLQGGTENSVGEEMGYDASTIHHYRQLLRDAQKYGTDPYLLRDWKKLKNTLDL